MVGTPIPPRLLNHTLVTLVLFLGGVVAPLLLFLGHAYDAPGSRDGFLVSLGVLLLGAGSGALVGGVLTRCIDRHACGVWQWRMLLTAAWVFNPVFVVVASAHMGDFFFTWWSGLPLAAAVVALSGRLRLVDGDPDWGEEGCPPRPTLCVAWIFSRMIFVMLPTCLLSFQAALYLPTSSMLPQGPEVGLFVCGGCVLISAKFCAMCACVARQRVAQAFVLVVLLSADWISSMHLMLILGDRQKVILLLVHLAVAGTVQMRLVLARLSLWPRWSRALQRRRAGARDIGSGGAAGVDVELGAHINAGSAASERSGNNSFESSDSEDERGPGSIPDGFHEAIVSLLGVPAPRGQGARRQFLCGVRSAVVCGGLCGTRDPGARTTPAPPQRPAQTGDSTGATAVAPEAQAMTEVERPTAPTSAAPAAAAAESPAAAQSQAPAGKPLEIPPSDCVCTVCQEEIRTGDAVRPLPKCGHVFHADCLERWAKYMREATRCPTCRRPALARRAAEGAVSIQALTASESGGTSPRTSGGRGGGRGSGARQGGRGRGAGRRVRSTMTSAGRPGRQIRQSSVDPSSASLANLQALGISEEMAVAALECAGGAADVAAHVVLEHRGLVVAAFATAPSRPTGTTLPVGLAEALVAANPDLAGAEVNVRRHLDAMVQSGWLPSNLRPWAELSAADRQRALVIILEDVVTRLESRAR
eukprot:TRINITY_DN20817_c1_g3_i2.p1 TRINITY_DN20817_c1_g3~~TRINITY_DN20817_c1_g3_i2.p1  ORF type:complete len:701 (-),score=92.79 TRINITY_DN20817_c1_g3_i2:64-2166(-)